jgi:replicative DNA helicase
VSLTFAAERALVGGVLEHGAIELSLVRSEVKPEDFSCVPARVTMEAMCTAADAGRELTIVEVASALEQAGNLDVVGGLRGLDMLRSEARVGERSAMLTHVRNAARLRVIGMKAVKLGASAGHPVAIADPDRYLAAVAELSNDARDGLKLGMATAAAGCRASLQALFARSKKVCASPTGLGNLDKILNPGFKRKKTYLVAARPGAGKSAFGTQAIGVGASFGHPQLMFSCEMSLTDVFDRIAIQRTHIDSERYEVGSGEGGLTESEFRTIIREFEIVSQLPIAVFDDESDLAAILAKARVWLETVARPWIEEHRGTVNAEGREQDLVPVVTIDYFQRCRLAGKWGTTEEMFAEMSRRIANFARDEDCAMVVMVQANKDNVKENRPPRASDMKYCDALAADADVVMILHRQLGADTKDPATVPESERGRIVEEPAMNIVDKHRGGRVGVAWSTWHGPTVRFTDRDQTGEPWVPKPATQAGRARR